MAERTNQITQGVAKRNLFQVVLQTGVNVLEMAGEIIRYNETVKQTAYIGGNVEAHKAHIRNRYDEHKKLESEQTVSVQQQLLLNLQMEEKKLQHAIEVYKQQFETQWLGDKAVVTENYAVKEMLINMLKTYNYVLGLCFKSMNETMLTDGEKSELDERYRVVSKQLHALLQEVQ